MERRRCAQWGEWAPDLKVRVAWIEVVESEMMHGEGWKVRAVCSVLKMAKSSAVCWLLCANFGRIQEV